MGSGATIQALDNNIPKVLQLSREQKEIFIFYGDHMILKTQYSQQQWCKSPHLLVLNSKHALVNFQFNWITW